MIKIFKFTEIYRQKKIEVYIKSYIFCENSLQPLGPIVLKALKENTLETRK